ncbi:MAG: SAM-dependent methyltransferase [Intrasporangium sp.]|uniref:SAM-dependent methyltransferase n=1 Tax=Intrasporangium sp. TaxID=1925024 RepID=UPI0026479FD2|nr:SAM-dependent methyltransferase [Intrasporangium sp.]MDN5795434.1 SAM-dependent methyltransferase [Intrasporangium sp.]
MSAVPWPVAWQHALYDAELGFYVTRGGPAAHFTTATQGPMGPVLAEALLRLWDRHVPDGPPSVIVDVGAGRGELATHLAGSAFSLGRTPQAWRVDRARSSGGRSARGPTGLSTNPFDLERSVRSGEDAVVGVDVVDRPAGLDEHVEWLRSPGGAALPDALHGLTNALVIAHEWLDVVPCTLAEVAGDGTLREVLVDPATGAEQLGPTLSIPDAAWAEQHWPTQTPGDRVEVGRTRDAAWADLVSRVESGLLVAIDYGHLAAQRPSGGTLAAYRDGHLTRPVPDGTCDLTAHVAMDSLDADVVHRQRDLLVCLGLDAQPLDHTRAQADPAGYLRALERLSAQARLIDPNGFGGFWWAVKRRETADVR